MHKKVLGKVDSFYLLCDVLFLVLVLFLVDVILQTLYYYQDDLLENS